MAGRQVRPCATDPIAMTIALALALGLIVGFLATRLVRRPAEPPIADQMKAATADALGDLVKLNAELREADRRAATADLEKRSVEFQRLTEPVFKGLERIEREVTDFGKARAETDTQTRTLLQQMRLGMGELTNQTSSLVKALRRPQTRGQWGEMQLRRCVELAGMTEHVDFALQQTIRDGEAL